MNCVLINYVQILKQAESQPKIKTHVHQCFFFSLYANRLSLCTNKTKEKFIIQITDKLQAGIKPINMKIIIKHDMNKV